MKRSVCVGGNFVDHERGISLGSPLSPLMGAVYLLPMDEAMAQLDVTYIRFMDDWLVVAPTRWKLRQAVRVVNQTLEYLKVKQHPDKTFIGKACRGFDFLGYAFWPSLAVLLPSPKALSRCFERIVQLYEQGADFDRIGQYFRRWMVWATSVSHWGCNTNSECLLLLVVFSLGVLLLFFASAVYWLS